MIPMNDGHPDEEDLRRFLAKTLPADDVDELEQHLVDCDACRGKLGVIARSIFDDSDAQLEDLFEKGREAAENARILERMGGNESEQQNED